VPTMRARPVRLLVAALLPAAAWPTLLDMWPNVRSEARQGPACCYHSNHVPPVPRYSTRYSCTAVYRRGMDSMSMDGRTGLFRL
jgi:hypothetical protein